MLTCSFTVSGKFASEMHSIILHDADLIIFNHRAIKYAFSTVGTIQNIFVFIKFSSPKGITILAARRNDPCFRTRSSSPGRKPSGCICSHNMITCSFSVALGQKKRQRRRRISTVFQSLQHGYDDL